LVGIYLAPLHGYLLKSTSGSTQAKEDIRKVEKAMVCQRHWAQDDSHKKPCN